MYDLEDFGYNNVNITSFRLINRSEENTRTMENMQRFYAKGHPKVLQVKFPIYYSTILLNLHCHCLYFHT